MTYDDILHSVQHLLAALLHVPVEDCVPDATLGGHLHFDSLDKFEIVMSVEEKYGLDLSDDVVEDWTTVDDIVRTVLDARNAEVAS